MNNNGKNSLESELVGVKLCDIHKEWYMYMKVWISQRQDAGPRSQSKRILGARLIVASRGPLGRQWVDRFENARECLWRGMISPTFFWSNRCSYHIFLTKIILNNFSLLPAPLHVPYREKDEDDDLEKAYKEVGMCVLCRPCWIFYQRLSAVIDRNIKISTITTNDLFLS